MKLFSKLLLEFTPLGMFFVFTSAYNFFTGTAVLMVTTVISLVMMWRLYRQVAIMAIISAATGLGSGAATLILHNEVYLQLKPTIVSLVFAGILLAGQLSGRQLFKMLLGHTLHLTEEGWRIVTWLWFGYFLFIAGLNEYVRLYYSPEFWALFKAAGLMPLTILYALPQIHFLKKHQLPEDGTFSPRPATAAEDRVTQDSIAPARQPT